MLLYYIRHGDPVYDPDHLTELGARQAEAAGRRLAMHGIDKIFASTSQRAIDTAKPLSEILKKDITLLDFCNESYAGRDFGVTNREGKRRFAFMDPDTVELFVSDEVRAMGRRWYEHPAFANENFAEGVARVDRETDALLASLGYEHDRKRSMYRAVKPNNDRIALFAHAGFGMAFLSSVLDIPYPEYSSHFDMCHSGMTVIEFTGEGEYVIPKMLMLSSDSHIYREGLPTLYNNRIYI